MAAAKQKANEAANHEYADKLYRIGYIGKGLVYLIIGYFAFQLAIGSGGDNLGSKGAIAQVSQLPAGSILLGLLALCLAGYSLWKFVQSLIDVENKGTDAKAIIARISFFISGIIHSSLAIFAGSLALGQGTSSGGSSKTSLVARALELPGGRIIVMIVALVILAVAIRQLQRSYKKSFMDDYKKNEMSQTEINLAKQSGIWGLAARGVVFIAVAASIAIAAWQVDPSEASGTKGALALIMQQNFGAYILAAVALGLIIYSFYCLFRARYRSFART